MKTALTAAAIVLLGLQAAHADTMIKIGEGKSWINLRHIVYVSEVGRDRAIRVNFGGFSAQGQFAEDFPEGTMFCQIGLSPGGAATVPIDCAEIIKSIHQRTRYQAAQASASCLERIEPGKPWPEGC
ncbi:MAG: hypothetical protein ACR2Q4_09655 [Geminicoccaceae bacterium]